MTKEKLFLSFDAKKVCHKGTNLPAGRVEKCYAFFLCDFVS